MQYLTTILLILKLSISMSQGQFWLALH